jgi:GNAT superfamily N-acetyltransferase
MNQEIKINFLADCQQHIPYLAALWYEQISKIWVPNASIERATENLFKHSNLDQLPLTLVATTNDVPVGMASLRMNDGIQTHHAPWLGSLVVDPAHRKQKIGEQLIDVIKQRTFLLGYTKLFLLAFDPTIPCWYERLGWKFICNDQLFGHSVSVMNINL